MHYILKSQFTAAFALVVVNLVSRVIYGECYQLAPSLRLIGFIPV